MTDESVQRGTQKVGSAETPDACSFCGTIVEPAPGKLGQGSVGGQRESAEPWRETAQCPNCQAMLARLPGDPWTGTST